MLLFILLSYYLLFSLLAWGMMIYDKRQAKLQAWRVSESRLLLLAYLGGAAGILLGMFLPSPHKVRKAKFQFQVPLFVLLHSLLLYYAYQTL